MIPRRIWTLWLQGWGEAPTLVTRCMDSWHHHNPDWELVALDAATVGDHLEPGFMASLSSLSKPQLSDAVRLALLSRHGGVWVDATLGCRHPLDSWLPAVSPAGFFAFGGGNRDRLAEPWFLAAEEANPLMARWAEEFLAFADEVNDETPNRLQRAIQYRMWRALHRTRFGLQSWMWRPTRRALKTNPYFAVHYVFNRVVASDPESAGIWEATPSRNRGTWRPGGGLDAAVATPEHRAEIDALEAPVVKVGWKDPVEVNRHETYSGYASRTLCADHPGPVPDV